MPSTSFDPKTTQALVALLARLADTKNFLGRDYAEWCSGAPTLESAVAAAAMAQDELGHARALYPLLRSLAPEMGAESDPETRTTFVNHAYVTRPFKNWEDFVAANFLVDTAMTTLFAAAAQSSYEPLAGRSRKALQEEQMHTVHGQAWVRRMSETGQAARAALESALRGAWDETLCWFGPERVGDPLAESGILDAAPDQLRERFLNLVGPTIEAAGLDLPVGHIHREQQYRLTSPLPWDRWDSAAYRLSVSESATTAASRHSSSSGDAS